MWELDIADAIVSDEHRAVGIEGWCGDERGNELVKYVMVFIED